MQGVKEKALELLRSGKADRVLGWKAGEFFYDLTPAVFESAEEAEKDFCYGPFSGANLSKYLIAESKKGGKIAVFLKPCDSFSFVQLQKEHRVKRENVYAVGIQCDGMCDAEAQKVITRLALLSVHKSRKKRQYDGLNYNQLENGVRGIQQGLCDGFYAQNTTALQGFNGVGRDLCQGFNSVNTNLNNGFNSTNMAINNVGYQM